MKMIRRSFSLFLVLILSMAFSFCSFADVATSSNAVLGFTPPEYLLSALSDDEDAGIMPMSSVVSITNTVNFSGARVYAICVHDDGSTSYRTKYINSDGSFKFQLSDYSSSEGIAYFKGFVLRLYDNNLPSSGIYNWEVDYASQFPFEYDHFTFSTNKKLTNAADIDFGTPITGYSVNAGDFYFKKVLQVTNPYYIDVWAYLKSDYHATIIDGSFSVRFVLNNNGTPDLITAGSGSTSDSVQSDIADSTSQIAGSVDNISSSIDNVEESLTYISNSQNLIIQGIDNIILHISDQLYAFWDQLYNLIHVPTLAKMNEILQAIKDLDINVNVDLDDLKASINSMKTAIVSQITSSTNQQITNDNSNRDHLENGYDNSSMTSDKDRLDSSISEYEEVEDQLIEDAAEHISDFEFNNDLNEYIGPIQDISYFLQGIFTGMGSMNVAVSFSLTLSVALLLIGWYRFKGGS